jgi:hypothetical protein
MVKNVEVVVAASIFTHVAEAEGEVEGILGLKASKRAPGCLRIRCSSKTLTNRWDLGMVFLRIGVSLGNSLALFL